MKWFFSISLRNSNLVTWTLLNIPKFMYILAFDNEKFDPMLTVEIVSGSGFEHNKSIKKRYPFIEIWQDVSTVPEYMREELGITTKGSFEIKVSLLMKNHIKNEYLKDFLSNTDQINFS